MLPHLSSKPVRFAVVGCGHIGSRHLAVIEANPVARLIAYCDDDQAALDKCTESYPHAKAYLDYERMLREEDIDIISICTPHALHAQMSIQAAHSGRHILVEKPMALNSRDSESMIVAARSNSVKLFVVKQNRYNQPVIGIKAALDNGRLGRPLMVQCNVIWNRRNDYYEQSPWRGNRLSEGGALQTQVSHFLDLMIWWFGDIIYAKTIMDTLNHSIQIEDCGSSALRFESGVVGSLLWTTCAYRENYEGSLTLICEKGLIKIGGKYLNKIEHWDVENMSEPQFHGPPDLPNIYHNYQGSSSNHDKLIAELTARFTEMGNCVVEGAEGMRTICGIEKIYAGV